MVMWRSTWVTSLSRAFTPNASILSGYAFFNHGLWTWRDGIQTCQNLFGKENLTILVSVVQAQHPPWPQQVNKRVSLVHQPGQLGRLQLRAGYVVAVVRSYDHQGVVPDRRRVHPRSHELCHLGVDGLHFCRRVVSEGELVEEERLPLVFVDLPQGLQVVLSQLNDRAVD